MEDEPDEAERTRPPLIGDLLGICRELNQRSVNYIVIGGMAINIHGFTRNTEDIDLLIETEETNERKILEVLSL
jgi:predicted nucleotidyltransferase